jgi:hypothetical protein
MTSASSPRMNGGSDHLQVSATYEPADQRR